MRPAGTSNVPPQGAGGEDLSRAAFRAALDSEREKWTRERDQLLNEIDTINREREMSQSDLNREMMDQRNYYEGVIAMLQGQIGDKEREAADAEARFQSREFEVGKLKTYALTLEGQLNEWRSAGTQYNALAKRYDDVEDARVYLENELQRLTNDLMTVQTDSKKANDERTRMTQRLEMAQQRINELQAERDGLKSDADRYRLGDDEGTRWKIRAVILGLELERLSNVFVGLNAELDQMGLRYREMERLYTNNDRELKNLRSTTDTNDRMRRDFEILRTQVSMLSQENDQLRSRVTSNESPQAYQTQNVQREMQEQIQMLQRSNEDLKKENIALQRRVIDLERDAPIRMSRDMEGLNQTIRELNRINEEYRRELDIVRGRGDLGARIQELEGKISMLVTENNRLQQELNGRMRGPLNYGVESPMRQSRGYPPSGQNSPRVKYVVRPYENSGVGDAVVGPQRVAASPIMNRNHVIAQPLTPQMIPQMMPQKLPQVVPQMVQPMVSAPPLVAGQPFIGDRYSVAMNRM